MVEWKELGSLGTFENIGTDKKIIEGEKLVTLLNYVDVYHHKHIDASIPQMTVSASDRKIKDCSVERGDIFVTPSSETVDDIGHSSVIEETIPNAVYSYHIMRFRLFEKDMLLSYYINYIFDTENVKKQILKKAQGLTRFGLSKDKFASIQIPVPSLEEQNRIVGILDTFTSAIDNLKEQIAERRKQYEHYRDQLLDLEEKEVKWYELIDLCDYVDYRGKTPTKVDSGIFLVTAKNIRKGYIDYDNSREYISENDYDEVMHRGKPQIGDVLITTEAPCGNVAQVDNDSIALAQRVIKYRPKDNRLHAGYLKYVLLGTDFQTRLDKEATGATAKGIKESKLHKMIVPVPSIEEQSRIVSILDTFEASVRNLEQQLTQREKQYEYYRNKLLTFD